MEKNIKIKIDLDDDSIKQQVFSCLEDMEDIIFSKNLEHGKVQDDTDSQLYVFNTKTYSEDLIKKVKNTREHHPHATLFVISPDKSPDHIIALIKAGADEFFPNPLNLDRFKEAIEKVRQKLALLKKNKGRLLSFISVKGGLGSTVVSVNTAVALALKKKESVALLDMSLQSGDSSVYLDALPQTTLSDICKNFHRLDFSFLKTSMLTHSTGLHYLAAPREPEDSVAVHGNQIQKVLHLTKNVYENVILDCTSMQVDECSLEAFNASDRIFLITDLSVPALRNAARLSQLLQKLSIPEGKIEVVVNRYIKGSATLQDVEKGLKKKIYWLFPNDFNDVIASINSGVPLVKGKPSATFAKNIFDFVDKLTNPEFPVNYRGVKGILGKAI